MSDFDLNDIERRMEGAISTLTGEFASLRTGRASVGILDPVMVEAYGSSMPLNQVGTVSVPESRMLAVSVWDKSMVAAVDKAIRNSGLGLNPAVDGTLIRIPLPDLNEERRRELSKVAAKYAEQTRVAIRNVRRDGMDKLKKMEKDSEISQDEHKAYGEDIQAVTDKLIKLVDSMLANKEKEIMQV